MSLLRFRTVWTVWVRAISRYPLKALYGTILFLLIGLFFRWINFDNILGIIFSHTILPSEQAFVGVAIVFTLVYGLGYLLGRIEGKLNLPLDYIALITGMWLVGMPIEFFFVHSISLLYALLISITLNHVAVAGILDGSKKTQFLYDT